MNNLYEIQNVSMLWMAFERQELQIDLLLVKHFRSSEEYIQTANMSIVSHTMRLAITPVELNREMYTYC